MDFSTSAFSPATVVLGPLGRYHLLPDSILGTLLLAVVLVGIYHAYSGRPMRGVRPSAVGALFVTNLVVFLLQGIPFQGSLAIIPPFWYETRTWGMLVPVLVVNGYTWWTPLTSMFMHASLVHIFANMLLFWVLGVKVEERIGQKAFVVLYLAAGLFADAVTLLAIYAVPAELLQGLLFHMPSETVPNLGASGAVYGLVGFSIFAFPRDKIIVPTPVIFMFWPAWLAAIFYVLFNLFVGLADPGVAWWAHLAGMLIGGIWGLAWRFTRGRTFQSDTVAESEGFEPDEDPYDRATYGR